jgi:hypothetical protein
MNYFLNFLLLFLFIFQSVLIASILTGLCLTARSMGQQHAFATGQLVYPKKPVSVDSCPQFMENYLNNSAPYDVE